MSLRDRIAGWFNPAPPGGRVTSVKRVATREPEPFYQQPPIKWPERHEDPGENFAPAPKPRTDRGVLPVRAGLVALHVPGGLDVEVSFQLDNGDWTPWRPARPASAPAVAAGVVSNHVAAIAGQWRLKGNTG